MPRVVRFWWAGPTAIVPRGAVSRERREQTYVVMPTLKTISVIQEGGSVRTEEEALGLVKPLALYAGLIYGTWWFWVRRRPTEGANPARR